MNTVVKDADGNVVRPGCFIIFSFGTPGVHVRAEVIERAGELIALTPGHNPPECLVRKLRGYVGDFWIARKAEKT